MLRFFVGVACPFFSDDSAFQEVEFHDERHISACAKEQRGATAGGEPQDLRGRNPCPSPSQGCPSSPTASGRLPSLWGDGTGSREHPSECGWGGCHCPGVRSAFWAARGGRLEAALAGEKVECVGSRVRVRGAPDGVWSRRTQAASLITVVDRLSVGSNSRSDWWELRSTYPSLVIVTLDNCSQYCFLNSFVFAFLNLSRPSFSNLFYDGVRW